MLKLFLFGTPLCQQDRHTVHLPRRKCLALLAYLVLNPQAHSREALAALLYPDSAHALTYLRRTLSEIRQSLGDNILLAENEVQLAADRLWVDVREFEKLIKTDQLSITQLSITNLQTAVSLYTADFMTGFTLPDAPEFDEWQFFEREGLRQSLAIALQQLIDWNVSQKMWTESIEYGRHWLSLDPLHEPAHRRLMQLYAWDKQHVAAQRQFEICRHLLHEELGIDPEAETLALYEAIKTRQLARGPATPRYRTSSTHSFAPTDQEIHFAYSADGTRIAYAVVGQGPPLVKVANPLTHLQYDWGSPVWQHWIEELSRHHTLIRYDERGCGLSDRQVSNFSTQAWVNDLEAVVDDLGLTHFPIFGMSHGPSVAVAYAVRHPERVSHLICFGAYARGRFHRPLTPAQKEEAEMLLSLVRAGWGQDNPAFRQVFATLFVPEGTPEQHQWFTELARVTAYAEKAAQMEQAFFDIDVSDLAPQVQCPTLVLHSRGDQMVPFAEGRLLADLIPQARFVPLESNNHVLLAHEPAWPHFLHEVYQFLEVPAAALPRQERRAKQENLFTPAKGNLPIPASSFIGREKEVADLKTQLTQPDTRLLTVTGQGGIGKTRLALAVGQQLQSAFAQGTAFVSLAPVNQIDDLAPAIAAALNVQFSGRKSPREQLLDNLRPHHLLLILDNFEHLLAGVDLLTDILQTAPQVKLLVTSRERLNVQSEWAYDLVGLTFPQHTTATASMSVLLGIYSAPALFVQRARQARAAFRPSAHNWSAILHICQLVEGMPLGLELAASWIPIMSCQEIAAGIAYNLDFLTTTLRDMPDRHRSVRAVFQHSWSLLTADEQSVLAQLSVFRGGFTREAAEQVTGATLLPLAGLVRKSLVVREGNGRYTIHELLRQFTAEKLSQSPADEAVAQAAHAAYFATFLRQCQADLQGGRQLEAVQVMTADFDNLRLCWQWLVEHQDAYQLNQAPWSLFEFCEMSGRTQEGSRLFQTAVEQLQSWSAPTASECERQTFAQLLTGYGWLSLRVGASFLITRQQLEQSARLLRPLQTRATADLAHILNYLGIAYYFTGEVALSWQTLEEALSLARAANNRYLAARALQGLGHIAELQGEFRRAEPYFQESVQLFRAIGEKLNYTYVLSNLGRTASRLGHFVEAEQLLQETLTIRRLFNNLVGIAYSLLDLGKLSGLRGDYTGAREQMQASLEIAEQIDSRDHIARIYNGLGWVAQACGDLAQAAAYHQHSLKIFREIVAQRALPLTLNSLAQIAAAQQDYQQARRYLEESLVISHDLANAGDQAAALHLLGHIAMAEGTIEEAVTNYRQALEIVSRTGAASLALDICLSVARLYLAPQANQPQQTANLLYLVLLHPATEAHIRKQAKQLIAEHNLSEPQENGDLWTAVATVRNDLAKIATLDGD